jgi:putative transposase
MMDGALTLGLGFRFTSHLSACDAQAGNPKCLRIFSINSAEIFKPGKQLLKVKARSLFCYWAVHELSAKMINLACKLNMYQPAASISAKRGERIAAENGYSLIDE